MRIRSPRLFLSLALILSVLAPRVRGQTTSSLTTVYNFSPASNNYNSDGAYPDAGLIQGTDGNFYGSTRGGGVAAGTVFQMSPSGHLTTLRTFSYGTNTDGAYPSGLVQGSDGVFYGTTRDTDGTFDPVASTDTGTVFRVTATAGFNTLYKFSATDGNGVNGDGAAPFAALVQGRDGSLYGTTYFGGAHDDGTVFRVSPDGAFTTLHNFYFPDGDNSAAALVFGSEGDLYGTTVFGGSPSGCGNAFKITTDGTFTDLHDFSYFNPDNADGANPYAALVRSSGGNFFGVSANGGDHGTGTVFRITPDGGFDPLHSFGALDANSKNEDGASPQAALLQGRDGNFYGTTRFGGAYGKGTIFELTPVGRLTTVYQFRGVDGANPSSLIQAADSSFYGTTAAGGTSSRNGASGSGTVFRLIVGPIITSADRAPATLGQPFSYLITATGKPTRYGVQGLPGGLTVNATTGQLSGTPRTAGTYLLTLNAYNGVGQGSAALTLAVQPAGPPAITSATTASGKVGDGFSYRITATNSPTTFGFQGNANGLTINAQTGVISGTPKASGSFTYMLNAYNSIGKGSATLTVTIAQVNPPVITSATSAGGRVRQGFFYQIEATNQPTRFGFQGNANGLTIDSSTGLISGGPKAAGTFTYTLNAYNSVGKGSATLTVTIAAE